MWEFFKYPQSCILFVLLAPFLKKLPCPEQEGAYPGEFKKRIEGYLAKLDLDYIYKILDNRIYFTQDLSSAEMQ